MIRWSDGVWSDEYMAKELQGMGGILVRPPDRGRGRGGGWLDELDAIEVVTLLVQRDTGLQPPELEPHPLRGSDFRNEKGMAVGRIFGTKYQRGTTALSSAGHHTPDRGENTIK